MFDDPKPQKALIPILVLIIVILLIVVAFQSGKNQRGDENGKKQTPPANHLDHSETEPKTVGESETVSKPEASKTEASKSETSEPEAVAVKSGEKMNREMLKKQGVRLVETAIIDRKNQEHLKKSVEEQKVYDSLLRWTMYGKVEDKKWGIRALLNMSYASEARLIRTVEKNDGTEIIVLYDFQSINTLEVLCDVESVKLDFMKRAKPYLAVGSSVTTTFLAPLFDGLLPGSGTVLKLSGAAFPIAADTFAERLALRGYKGISNLLDSWNLSDKKGKISVFGSTDSLQGKKVRITHRHGVVEEIEPVGCDLTEAERNLCANLGVLADYHIMPEVNVPVGETWFVRADQFSNILDPSMRGIPSGTLEITRKENNGTTATLEITGGFIELDSSDTKSNRIGKCTPRGQLRYNVEDGFVESALLHAEISIDRLSKRHILFETRFKSTPKLEMEYECSKGTEKLIRIPQLQITNPTNPLIPNPLTPNP
ncbi:MAG: hypothetical protein LBP87_00175 [Planctomycetaceae bacterium]|jgi:hypothetical protein|nr:hypothetical protein [Planctomycetaceae bacterium]